MDGRTRYGLARWGAALWLAAWLSIQGAGAAVTLALTPGGADPVQDERESFAVSYSYEAVTRWGTSPAAVFHVPGDWKQVGTVSGMVVEFRIRELAVQASHGLDARQTCTRTGSGSNFVVSPAVGRSCIVWYGLAAGSGVASGTVQRIVVGYSIRVRVTGTLRKGRYRFDYPLTVGGAGTPIIRAGCMVGGVQQACPAATTNIPITVDVAHSITVPTLGGAVTLTPTGSGSWSSAGQSLAAVTSTSGFYRLSIRSCTHHEPGSNRCGLQHATAGGEVFPVRVQAGSVEVDRGSPQQLASGAGGALRFEMDAATARRMQGRAGSYRGDITLLFEADIEP